MQKVILVLLIVIIFALGYIIFKPEKQTQNYSQKFDSIQTELSFIKNKRDSISRVMDTTVIKIKENEKYYKEVVNTIIHNTVDDDYVFFINYLKRYDSINNPDSTKEN